MGPCALVMVVWFDGFRAEGCGEINGLCCRVRLTTCWACSLYVCFTGHTEPPLIAHLASCLRSPCLLHKIWLSTFKRVKLIIMQYLTVNTQGHVLLIDKCLCACVYVYVVCQVWKILIHVHLICHLQALFISVYLSNEERLGWLLISLDPNWFPLGSFLPVRELIQEASGT